LPRNGSGAPGASGTRIILIAVGAEHLAGAVEREPEGSRRDLDDREQAELQRGHNAETPAAAAQRPEQVRVMIRVDSAHPAVNGDDLRGEQVGAGQTVLAGEPAHPAAEGVSGHPDAVVGAVQAEQAVSRGGRRHGAPGDAAAHSGDPAVRIDGDLLQQ
jgi:hypothetical protein